MQPRSERLRISKRSKPYSSLRATRAAQIAKGTSVSDRMSADCYPQIQGPDKTERILAHRSKMGELESGSVRVHTV